MVIKPLNLSFAKGTTLVERPQDLKKAYDYALSYTKTPRLVVNEFIKGTEYSSEGLMIGGKLFLTALSERVFKYDEYKPHFIEVGDIMPVDIPVRVQKKLEDETHKAAVALEIHDGVVKGDLIVDAEENVYVFEIAARLGGPRFGTDMVPLSNGTNILRPTIQQALGEKIDVDLLKPKFSKGMVNRAIFPNPGRITKISGFDQLSECNGFHSFKWCGTVPMKEGDVINPYRNNSEIIGYFIASGETRQEAIRNANKIEATIRIETASMT